MVYDYIIVGAGSAGCVLANRLSEDSSVTVLLLEAGGKGSFQSNIPGAYATLHNSIMDWAFWTETQPYVNNRKLFIPRGKALGGCSATNAMAYVRGNAEDYDHWAALGNSGWSYKEVLPYFKKSENHEIFDEPYHSKRGLLNVGLAKYPSHLSKIFIEACIENGIPYNEDYNNGTQLGAGMLQYTIKNNRRQSTMTAFLQPAMKRPNLTVRTEVLVKRVLIEKDKAVGVELITGKTITESVFCKRQIIISAGAIKSPQLLMLSGIGKETLLKQFGIDVKLVLPGVGQNLQDHVWAPASNLCKVATSNNDIKPINRLKALLQYLFFNKGPLCNSPIEANAFIKTDPALTKPDIQFHFAPFHIGDDYQTNIYNLNTFPKTNGFTILTILLHPKSRSAITLRTTNPLDSPIIQPNFFEAETDRSTILAGLKIAMEVLDAKAFRPFSPGGLHHPLRNLSDEALMQHICRSLETLYHPVGTCKMGNDEMSVVNDRLEVHGVKGLSVIDASIMPFIISGNTNAACMMIGEKAQTSLKMYFDLNERHEF